MKFKKIAVIICRSILEKKKENECGNQITYFWRTCLKSIFQNVNVLAATTAILTIFGKVLVMKNMSEIHFSKCNCPGGYVGDPHNFYQCSGHGVHV